MKRGLSIGIRSSDKKGFMRIAGFDPGTRITGYGIVEGDGVSQRAVDYGCIRPRTTLALEDRYFAIYKGVKELLARHSVDVVVVETQFVLKNAQSALKLGMARGVIVIAAKELDLPVVGYAPSKAKQAVVGNGKASKAQVQGMVQLLLGLGCPPHPEDAADALALALCHLHASQMRF